LVEIVGFQMRGAMMVTVTSTCAFALSLTMAFAQSPTSTTQARTSKQTNSPIFSSLEKSRKKEVLSAR